MKTQYIKISILLALMGTIFSGYLSATKFFSDSCAFNESCPYFLGQPACYYGFAMFLVMLVLTLISYFGKISAKKLAEWLFAVSLVGIIFSGYFVIAENFAISTCLFGLLFYVIICLYSLKFKKTKN